MLSMKTTKREKDCISQISPASRFVSPVGPKKPLKPARTRRESSGHAETSIPLHRKMPSVNSCRRWSRETPGSRMSAMSGTEGPSCSYAAPRHTEDSGGKFLDRETRRKIESIVEQVAGEFLDHYKEAIRASPGMKFIDIVQSEVPLSLWFAYGLIVETRRLRWLTVVLITLTAVLAGLTLRLALN